MSTLCIVHNNVDDRSSIGKIARLAVCTALAAGWKVTVVARDLDDSLQGEVEWLHLYVPPRLHLVQWLAARPTIKAAIINRQFDVVHVYQPQVASLADVMHCQFLTRAAADRHCLETRSGLKHTLMRIQQQGVLHAEDYYFRHWNARTRMVYCSGLLRNEFHKLYGRRNHETVLVNAAPPAVFLSEEQRQAARAKLVNKDFSGIVVGYLGGVDARKGFDHLIESLRNCENTFLLMGGPASEGFDAHGLKGRFASLGMVRDLTTFFAACDLFVVPSVFEPLGLVAFEAAAHGVPVIATAEVGALPHLLEHGAGMLWEADMPLSPLLREAMARREELRAGALRLVAHLSGAAQGRRLLAVYEDILREKEHHGKQG